MNARVAHPATLPDAKVLFIQGLERLVTAQLDPLLHSAL
jgi:hypothetical protein